MRFCLSLLFAIAIFAAPVSTADVNRIHSAALLVDLHNDITSKTVTGWNIATSDPRGSTDVPRLRKGNVGATFFAAYVSKTYVKDGRSDVRCRDMIRTIREDIVGKHPDIFSLATTADDIVKARKAGKMAALIGIEGGHAIEDSLDKLREFFNLGARYMTLTHSNTNNWADSSGDAKRHRGLSDFGEKVVGEMNRLGMMVDISHVADETFWDALAVSKAPLIASHSSCRALTNHMRNMTDDMIRAMAKQGGVIHINFACGFINEQSRVNNRPIENRLWADASKTIDDVRAAVEANKATHRATLADVVAHIDYAVKIAGVDAVGIGSDFDGIGCTPVGLEDVSKYPALTRALLEKGYTEGQIRKIYGENTLRVMRAVEQTARTMNNGKR